MFERIYALDPIDLLIIVSFLCGGHRELSRVKASLPFFHLSLCSAVFVANFSDKKTDKKEHLI